VPKRLLNAKRNTIGVRVPDHNVVRALLEEMGEPLLSSTLMLPGDELPLNDMDEIRNRMEYDVDVILDGGPCGVDMTTVVDLTGDMPVIVRRGKGSTAPFGVAA
jgi:tRNA threonylcarbamoyl adenosine modification protein (Sua5/YciO/YrdC/YwlC family)